MCLTVLSNSTVSLFHFLVPIISTHLNAIQRVCQLFRPAPCFRIQPACISRASLSQECQVFLKKYMSALIADIALFVRCLLADIVSALLTLLDVCR